MSETPGRVLGRLFVETMLAPDEDGVNIWRGSEADGYRDEFERIAAAFLAEMARPECERCGRVSDDIAIRAPDGIPMTLCEICGENSASDVCGPCFIGLKDGSDE